MRKRNLILVLGSLTLTLLGLSTGCGGDEDGGSGGASSGGTGGAGGAGGAGGTSGSGGAAGSGGSSAGGTSGSGGAAGSGGANTGGSDAGSDASSGGSSGSGGSDAGACTQPADAGAACNTLANGASFVKITAVASGVPTGTGGTIADGHYFMTKLEGYTGTGLGSLTMKQTLDICAGVGQLVGEEKGPAYHKSFTLTTNGTSIDATTTCSTQSPNVDVKYASYTATPTSLTLYSTTFLFSVTYTKQ